MPPVLLRQGGAVALLFVWAIFLQNSSCRALHYCTFAFAFASRDKLHVRFYDTDCYGVPGTWYYHTVV